MLMTVVAAVSGIGWSNGMACQVSFPRIFICRRMAAHLHLERPAVGLRQAEIAGAKCGQTDPPQPCDRYRAAHSATAAAMRDTPRRSVARRCCVHLRSID